MKQLSPYIILIIPVVLFVAALIAVYPYYQYYVDPDAVAYLTIAKRYAAGDVKTAVNGYWSPWSCWLTALLIRQGMEAFKAAIFINAMGGLGFLAASYVLFVRLIKDNVTLLALSSTLAVFLVYAVFKQSFADLWYMFFLMGTLLWMLHKHFIHKPLLWVVTGIFGALAYFAKAYAFPYFLLSTLVAVAFLIKRNAATFSYKKWLIVSGVIIMSMLLISAPWIGALHEKYSRWMTSASGSLNLSWYLVGHPFFKEGITLLIPPVYPDAVYYWEDPFLANGAAPHFYQSPWLFLMQIVRLGYTLLKLVNSMNELSAFFLLISLVGTGIVFIKKIRTSFPDELFLICILFLLFPSGYLFINFESRYLWYLLPFSMIIGAMLIGKLSRLISNKRTIRIVLAIFCFSYLVFPVWDMKALYRAGEKEYHLAQELKKQHIKGTFVANIYRLEPLQEVIRVAYFSGNSMYYMPWAPRDKYELLNELHRYQVTYYFHFHDPFERTAIQFEDADGTPFPVVFEDTSFMGLKIYEMHR